MSIVLRGLGKSSTVIVSCDMSVKAELIYIVTDFSVPSVADQDHLE